jgi:hypothetical protein
MALLLEELYMATILDLAQKTLRGELPPPPVGRLLGLVLKSIEPARAVFEMEADERHHNPMGTLHGGKAFEEVARAFERQLGRFEPDVYKALASGGDAEGAKSRIETMAGPSGCMFFGKTNHGALMREGGQV